MWRQTLTSTVVVDHPSASNTLIRHLTAGDYVERVNELDGDNTLYIQNGQRSGWGCIM